MNTQAMPVFSELNNKGVEIVPGELPEGATMLHKLSGSIIRRKLKKGGVHVLCDAKPLYFVQKTMKGINKSIPYFNCLIPGSGWNVVALTSLVPLK